MKSLDVWRYLFVQNVMALAYELFERYWCFFPALSPYCTPFYLKSVSSMGAFKAAQWCYEGPRASPV